MTESDSGQAWEDARWTVKTPLREAQLFANVATWFLVSFPVGSWFAWSFQQQLLLAIGLIVPTLFAQKKLFCRRSCSIRIDGSGLHLRSVNHPLSGVALDDVPKMQIRWLEIEKFILIPEQHTIQILQKSRSVRIQFPPEVHHVFKHLQTGIHPIPVPIEVKYSAEIRRDGGPEATI